MALKTHRILLRHQGENATTPHDPITVAVKEEGNLVTYLRKGKEEVADLNKQVSRCIAWDFDMPTMIEEYHVTDVVLPEWLDPEEWLANTTEWKWLWSLRGMDTEWSEVWQRGLRRLSNTGQRLAAVELLKTKNFRSTFRKSLRDQIVAWLETPSDERRHSSPLSPRQWDSLVDARTARRYDDSLYNAKGFRDARKMVSA